MNYKKILKVVGVVAVATVFSIGCSEKPNDGEGSHVNTPTAPDNPNNSGGRGGGKGNKIGNYRTVTIGTQKWMAENLDNAVAGSVCYGNFSYNCTKYGRLYTWEAAKTACPSGWRLPTNAEWTMLVSFVGGSAGTKLKSKTGWNNDGNGTDAHGVSALPGGIGSNDGYFFYVGNEGHWWSATGFDTSLAWSRSMRYDNENVVSGYDFKSNLLSVRCVQD